MKLETQKALARKVAIAVWGANPHGKKQAKALAVVAEIVADTPIVGMFPDLYVRRIYDTAVEELREKK